MTKMIGNAVKNSVSCPARSRNAAFPYAFLQYDFFRTAFIIFIFTEKRSRSRRF